MNSIKSRQKDSRKTNNKIIVAYILFKCPMRKMPHDNDAVNNAIIKGQNEEWREQLSELLKKIIEKSSFENKEEEYQELLKEYKVDNKNDHKNNKNENFLYALKLFSKYVSKNIENKEIIERDLMCKYVILWAVLENLVKIEDKYVNNEEIILRAIRLLNTTDNGNSNENINIVNEWYEQELRDVFTELKQERNNIVHKFRFTLKERGEEQSLEEIMNKTHKLERLLRLLFLSFLKEDKRILNKKEILEIVTNYKKKGLALNFPATHKEFREMINYFLGRWFGSIDTGEILKYYKVCIDTYGGLMFKCDKKVSRWEPFYKTNSEGESEERFHRENLIIPSNAVFEEIIKKIIKMIKEINKEIKSEGSKKQKEDNLKKKNDVLLIFRTKRSVSLSTTYLWKKFLCGTRKEINLSVLFKKIVNKNEKESENAIINITNILKEFEDRGKIKNNTLWVPDPDFWPRTSSPNNKSNIINTFVINVNEDEDKEIIKNKFPEKKNGNIIFLSIENEEKRSISSKDDLKEYVFSLFEFILQHTLSNKKKEISLLMVSFPNVASAILGLLLQEKGFYVRLYEYGYLENGEKGVVEVTYLWPTLPNNRKYC